MQENSRVAKESDKRLVKTYLILWLVSFLLLIKNNIMPNSKSNTDVHEIQSFVNVALATAAGGEGDLSHDRLSHLKTVGSGFASLIYNFPEDADFLKLKEACKSVWDALDKNENLPKLIVMSSYYYGNNSIFCTSFFNRRGVIKRSAGINQ